MDIMNLLGGIRDMTFNAWANIAMWLGFMDRRIGETSPNLIRRGIVRSLIIHLIFFSLLIGSTMIPGGVMRYVSILLVIPTLLSLALFWATMAFMPIAVAHVVRTAGVLPDANFFENLTEPIPTGSAAMSKYRSIALWEVVLVFYISIARYLDADLTLLWMTIIAVFVIILAGSSPKGSARMISSIAKMIVLVTVIMQFWSNGRQVFDKAVELIPTSSSQQSVSSEQPTTTPMAPSVQTFGGRFAGEIPTASLDRLRELYVIWVADGRLDDMIISRAKEIGADEAKLDEWEKKDRKEAGFGTHPNGSIEEQVFLGDWSPRVLTGGENKWRYFVDGERIWNVQNDRGEIVLDAGANMTNSFMSHARWLKFQIDSSDLALGPNTVWVQTWE